MPSARSAKTCAQKSKTRDKPASSPVEPVAAQSAVTTETTPAQAGPAAPTKLAQLVERLQRPEGATVAQLAEALGWRTHSVRGAMAGALKGRGHVVTSQKTEAGRVYRLPQPADAQA